MISFNSVSKPYLQYSEASKQACQVFLVVAAALGLIALLVRHLNSPRNPPAPFPNVQVKELFEELERETKNVECLVDREEVFHRFADIHCPRKTAIPADYGWYLHANKVCEIAGASLIAAQAPVEAAVEDFWTYCLQEKALIVDLTNQRDGVNAYYPQVDKWLEVGERMIFGQASTREENYTLYSYHEGDQTIERLHFTAWNDYQGTNLKAVAALIEAISEKIRGGIKTVVIHCRAGVGRSGSLITMLRLKHEFQANQDPIVQIKKAILEGREARGNFFVQKEVQLQLIIQYVKEHLCSPSSW